MNMYVQLVHEKAKMPTRAHYNDAGLDVFTPVDVTINPGEKVMINTGIKWVIPDGWVAIIKDKSGLSCNFDLTTRAGVIDAGYRGEVVIKLHNEGTEPFKFKAGEKISQVLVVPCWIGNPEQVDDVNVLPTTRGDNGFGSTGK